MLVASSVYDKISNVSFQKTYSQQQKYNPYFFFYLSKPKIKSIDISIQGSLGTGKGVYKP